MATNSAVYPPDVVPMSIRKFCRYIDWRRERLGRTWEDLANDGEIPTDTLRDMAFFGIIDSAITLEKFSRLMFALGLMLSHERSVRRLVGFPGNTSVVELIKERRIYLEPVTPIIKR